MKKYSGQLILLLFFVMQLCAMEEPCYLAKMPVDVCNRIAYFSLWETKKQFIKRMSKKRSESLFYQGGDGIKIFACIDSADKSKKAIISSLCGNDQEHHKKLAFNEIRVLDCMSKQKLFRILMSYSLYLHAAISCTGDIVAVIQKQERRPEEILHYYHNMLTVRKIKKGKICTVLNTELPEGYTPLGLDFNYQGTHVYIPGNQYDNKGDVCKKDKMFSLKVTDVYKDKETDQQNALQQYFKYYCVCKKLMG